MGFLTQKIYGLNAQKWVKHTIFVGQMQYELKTHTSGSYNLIPPQTLSVIIKYFCDDEFSSYCQISVFQVSYWVGFRVEFTAGSELDVKAKF